MSLFHLHNFLVWPKTMLGINFVNTAINKYHGLFQSLFQNKTVYYFIQIDCQFIKLQTWKNFNQIIKSELSFWCWYQHLPQKLWARVPPFLNSHLKKSEFSFFFKIRKSQPKRQKFIFGSMRNECFVTPESSCSTCWDLTN